VQRAADRLLRGEQRYRAVSAATGVPWQLVGIMHGVECGYDFNKHLHNGDPLGAATVRVPQGRPPGWVAGSRWEDSAVDALELKRFEQVREWSLPRVLYALEAFNGFGYRGKGIRSPYLWSFSNLYEKGKYIRDHVYDPEAVSQQVGSAVVLKHLEQQGLWR
jgi:lysozyme family protein